MTAERDLGHFRAAPDRYPDPVSPARSRRTSADFTGAATLWQFMLRRDRTRILVWTVSLGALYLFCVVALGRMFGDPEAQSARAAIMRTPASVLMSGPGYGLDHYSLGPIMANELLLWLAAALALMSIFQVVRHTRGDEESSRSELVRAQPVGRHAATVAAVGTVVVANLAVAVVGFAALVIGGLPVWDSIAYVLAVALAALCFAAIALVLSQISATSRAASGLSVAVLLASVFVRGAGDMEAVGGSALSWLSPFGWSQQTRVFVDLRWWPLLISVAFVIAILGLAAFLGNRRDFGAGLLPQRLGRASARAYLRSPGSLAWRILRPSTIWWGIGIFVSFLGMGTYITDIDTLVGDMAASNPIVGDILNPSDIVGSFTHLMLLYGALAAMGYGAAALVRARGEETSGRLESVLATPVSRSHWLGANLGVPALAVVGLMLLSALGLFAGAASVGVTDPTLPQYLLAVVVYLPGIAVVLALAAVLFAWAPRLLGIVWAFVGYGFVQGMFGEAIGLPNWLRGLDPLYWTPNPLGSAGANYWPLLWLGLLAAALTVLAFIGFRRRDLPQV